MSDDANRLPQWHSFGAFWHAMENRTFVKAGAATLRWAGSGWGLSYASLGALVSSIIRWPVILLCGWLTSLVAISVMNADYRGQDWLYVVLRGVMEQYPTFAGFKEFAIGAVVVVFLIPISHWRLGGADRIKDARVMSKPAPIPWLLPILTVFCLMLAAVCAVTMYAAYEAQQMAHMAVARDLPNFVEVN